VQLQRRGENIAAFQIKSNQNNRTGKDKEENTAAM
jgi:hypothetical protein